MQGGDGLVSILFSAFFGAMASVGQLLASAKILTPRRIVASMFGGITGGVFSGAIFGMVYPELSQNILLVSGAGSLGGVAGVHAMMAYFFAKHAPEILGKHSDDSDSDSMTMRKLFDSGEHSQEDIERFIEQKRLEREQRRAQARKTTGDKKT